MKKIKLWSWNVNGIRAAAKKGALEPVKSEGPDIICLQETKAHPDQLPETLINWEGYHSFFSPAQKKGYSGVAIYSKIKPNAVRRGFGIERFDQEGRILIAEYDSFVLLNIYHPNGQSSPERLQYKYDFYQAFLDYINELVRQGKKIIAAGDINTAHKEIDIARPKENSQRSGFLPEERAWLDKFVEHGYLDTFRCCNSEPHQYSWWDYKTRARERNVGWRIDYFFISSSLKKHLVTAGIRADIMGSDHCPVTLEISI